MEIRPVSLNDYPQMNSITQELGYPSSKEKMRKILQLVLNKTNQEIYVAEIDSHLAGYIHLVRSEKSETRDLLDIAALIVDTKFRGRGVGNAFVQKAEDTARIKHATHLRIRTNLISPEAYKFFEHRGFVNLSSHNEYVKELV